MSEQVELLRRALRQQLLQDGEGEDDLAVEKMGDAAFDWIVQEVRGERLTPTETVRGLRLLSRLTRQFCVRRKGELLDLTLHLAVAREADREVRSTAAHIAASPLVLRVDCRMPRATSRVLYAKSTRKSRERSDAA